VEIAQRDQHVALVIVEPERVEQQSVPDRGESETGTDQQQENGNPPNHSERF